MFGAEVVVCLSHRIVAVEEGADLLPRDDLLDAFALQVLVFVQMFSAEESTPSIHDLAAERKEAGTCLLSLRLLVKEVDCEAPGIVLVPMSGAEQVCSRTCLLTTALVGTDFQILEVVFRRGRHDIPFPLRFVA